MADLLGWLAAAINVFGFVLYFMAMRGNSTTSAIGWFLMSTIAISASISQFSISSLANSASYFLGALCCVIVFLMSLKNKCKASRNDVVTMGISLAVVALSVIEPTWAIYCLCFYYLLSYSVFLRAIRNGAREPVKPWLIWCTGAIMQMISIRLSEASLVAYVLPMTNLVCWMSVAVFANQQARGRT